MNECFFKRDQFNGKFHLPTINLQEICSFSGGMHSCIPNFGYCFAPSNFPIGRLLPSLFFHWWALLWLLVLWKTPNVTRESEVVSSCHENRACDGMRITTFTNWQRSEHEIMETYLKLPFHESSAYIISLYCTSLNLPTIQVVKDPIHESKVIRELPSARYNSPLPSLSKLRK